MKIIPDNIPVSSNVLSCLIVITDDEWNTIGTGWVKEGGHKKWLVDVENGKFHYEEVKPFSQYLKELIKLKRTK